MLEDKELVEQTENVEETTEEIEEAESEIETEEETVEEEVKLFTQEEVDEIVAKKVGRQREKMRREMEREYAPYKEAGRVLTAGMGVEDVAAATGKAKEFYKGQGVAIPDRVEPEYSERDLKVLAANEAREIIDMGIDEVVEEVDRLANKGFDKMSPREKLVFTQLADHRKAEQERVELAKIGVKPEELQDEGFQEFAKNLNPNLSAKERYEMYQKYKPKPKIKPMGSMKSTQTDKGEIKDYYTYEESLKFTKEDYLKNPELLKVMKKSMPTWK